MSQFRRVSLVLLLNAAMIAGLVVVGIASNSLAQLSEGGDYLAESLALGLGLVAIYLRDHHRKEKATSWVALVNGACILAISLGVGIRAVGRLASGARRLTACPYW